MFLRGQTAVDQGEKVPSMAPGMMMLKAVGNRIEEQKKKV
jgi:hypothetical protein